MKRRRIVAIVASGVLATTALGIQIGFSSVAKASQTGAQYLCVEGAIDECAYGASPVEIKPENTNWYYPYQGTGEIQQADTNRCMQVDHNDGNIILEATCTGAAYQEWTIESNGYQFQSRYNTADCLTYNQNGQDLDIVACGNYWYQVFEYPST